jgi:DNA-directed RNA polymerase subunit RPC12/RpoP
MNSNHSLINLSFKYKCLICGMEMKNQETLRKHIRHTHCEDIRVAKLSRSYINILNRSNIDYESLEKMTELAKIYNLTSKPASTYRNIFCKKCFRIYANNQNLNNHKCNEDIKSLQKHFCIKAKNVNAIAQDYVNHHHKLINQLAKKIISLLEIQNKKLKLDQILQKTKKRSVNIIGKCCVI